MQTGRNRKNKVEGNPKTSFRPNRLFILDTSVLLHDSNSIFAFKGVVVGIPFVVLEELDHFKENTGERGRNARHVIRALDELRSRGCLSDGVELNHSTEATLKVLPTPELEAQDEKYGDIIDNLIIKTVAQMVHKGLDVTFVTKDINARVKADSMGLDAEDYTKGKVHSDEFYRGWTKFVLPAAQVKSLTANKITELLVKQKVDLSRIFPNEFIIVEHETNPEKFRLFRFFGGENFQEIKDTKIIAHFGARNVQQLMALELLRDDNIKIVSLIGSAGTGKTFLTLLMGLQKVASEHLYRKFLISRPVVALGADIGYLPGEMQEKMRYWMQPVYDNFDFIFSQIEEFDEEGGAILTTKKERRHQKRHPKHKVGETSAVDRLQQKGILSLEAITYMRGRSIPYQFVFIDEVQNLTPHEVKTIVSRAGEGTKIILAGDPFQIDSPYLDFSSNGLTITTEKFKESSIFGTVFLEKSERSEVAKLAAKLL